MLLNRDNGTINRKPFVKCRKPLIGFTSPMPNPEVSKMIRNTTGLSMVLESVRFTNNPVKKEVQG